MSSFIGFSTGGSRKNIVEELAEFLKPKQQECHHGMALVYGVWGIGKTSIVRAAKDQNTAGNFRWMFSGKPYRLLSVESIKDLLQRETGQVAPEPEFSSVLGYHEEILDWIDKEINAFYEDGYDHLVIWYLASDYGEDFYSLQELFHGRKPITRKMIIQSRKVLVQPDSFKPMTIRCIQPVPFKRSEMQDEVKDFIKNEFGDIDLQEDTFEALVPLVARLGGSHPGLLKIACTLVKLGNCDFDYDKCDQDKLRERVEIKLFKLTKYEHIWMDPLRELGKSISYENETDLEVHGLLIEESGEKCPVVLIRKYQEISREKSSYYDESNRRGVLGVLQGDSDVPIGVAFWVKQGVIVTCTHVIRDAVDAMDIEEENVKLRSFSRDTIEAEVVYCEAPTGTESKNLSARHEVCVLKPISSDENFYRYTFDEGYSAGQKVVAFGFPVKNPAGKYTSVDPEKAITISGEFGDGYVELQGDDVSEQIEQGMSGSPLLSAIDDKREDILDRNIVGMMRGKYPWDDKGLMIPSQLIIQVINNSNS